jgi:hypothetical protein
MSAGFRRPSLGVRPVYGVPPAHAGLAGGHPPGSVRRHRTAGFREPVYQGAEAHGQSFCTSHQSEAPAVRGRSRLLGVPRLRAAERPLRDAAPARAVWSMKQSARGRACRDEAEPSRTPTAAARLPLGERMLRAGCAGAAPVAGVGRGRPEAARPGGRRAAAPGLSSQAAAKQPGSGALRGPDSAWTTPHSPQYDTAPPKPGPAPAGWRAEHRAPGVQHHVDTMSLWASSRKHRSDNFNKSQGKRLC